MDNTDQELEQPTELEQPEPKKPFLKNHYILAVAAAVLAGGGLLAGYNVGHKQGLTVVGFDADAQELAAIVGKQKNALDAVTGVLNTASLERDVAVTSAKELNLALTSAKEDKSQAEALSNIYREKLRERGGVSLTIHNVSIKPLPSNAFEYVLDLVQVNPNRRRATGRIEIRLVRGTEILTVPLESDSYNFENYERLTGRWTMPNGFTPQFIEIHLKSSSDALIQRFAWNRGKQEIDVPAFIAEIPQTEANAD